MRDAPSSMLKCIRDFQDVFFGDLGFMEEVRESLEDVPIGRLVECSNDRLMKWLFCHPQHPPLCYRNYKTYASFAKGFAVL